MVEVETSHTSSMATIVSRNNSKPSRWWGVVNLKMYRVKSNQKYWLFCCKYIFNDLFSSSVLPFDFLSAMPCRERPKWMYVFIFWQRSSAGCTVKGTRTHTQKQTHASRCPNNAMSSSLNTFRGLVDMPCIFMFNKFGFQCREDHYNMKHNWKNTRRAGTCCRQSQGLTREKKCGQIVACGPGMRPGLHTPTLAYTMFKIAM